MTRATLMIACATFDAGRRQLNVSVGCSKN